jgi:hypothetical protein
MAAQQIYQSNSKMYVLVLSSCLSFSRAGSLDEVWMLLHQTLYQPHP